MAKINVIKVEVAYAIPTSQRIIAIEIAVGSTVKEAIECSGILKMFPEIDLEKQNIGIFSQKKSLADLVHEGDRIEIYGPLLIDPKEARRAKAKKNQSI